MVNQARRISNAKRERPRPDRGLHTHRSEQLLLEQLGELPGDRLLCTTLGRAQLAAVAAVRSPTRQVVCHFLDAFRRNESARLHGEQGQRLRLDCSTDFPQQEFDAAALPLSATGEGELARERMQSAHMLLVQGGRLAVSTDNARDTFFHGEMQKLFRKVTRIPAPRGVAYIGTKTEPLKRVRDFSAEVPFRDAGRLFKLFTRPGVFSHRKVDAGARALMEAVEVPPGATVLELGCGAGPVAVAIAGRDPSVTMLAVDSNPRAVACTQKSAELNGLKNVFVELNAEARYDGAGKVDLVVGNPPYFSKFRIAELFLDSAFAALNPGGRLLIVTKQPGWFQENLSPRFRDVRTRPVRNYVICEAVKPR